MVFILHFSDSSYLFFLPHTLPISFDENMRPAILAYQEAQKEFKVNEHQKLSEEERAVVADVWADYFAYYKYNP